MSDFDQNLEQKKEERNPLIINKKPFYLEEWDLLNKGDEKTISLSV